MNTLPSNVDPEPDSLVCLNSAKSPEENAALVIMEGLSVLEDDDLKCLSKPPLVNVVSFSLKF